MMTEKICDIGNTRQDIDCELAFLLKILGKKWMIFILSQLLKNEELYFSELQIRIRVNHKVISAKALSDNLNILEKNDLIKREVISDSKPVRVKYKLTEKGRDLKIIFGALKGWGIKWGDLESKHCGSVNCLYNSVPALDIDKAWDLLHKNE